MAFLGPSLRRKRVSDRPAVRAVVAGLISLLVNAALLVALALAGAFDLARTTPPERVELAPLSAEEWNQNRAVAGSPTPPAPPVAPVPPPVVAPPPSPPPPEPREKGQVVDVTPGNDRKPDDARFLAEHDNRVAKETRSRDAGKDFHKNRAPGVTAGGEQREQKKAGQGGMDEETQEAREARGGKAGRERAAPEKAAEQAQQGDRLAMLDRPRLPQVSPGDRSRPGEGDEEGLGLPGPSQEAQPGKRKSGDARLLPSVESMSRIAGGPSNDYIDGDVEEGDVTALNTRANRFVTFWNRFKQDVAEHWVPAVRYDIGARDPQGSTFGRRGWLTELHIVLDRTGTVKEIQVIGPSGLDFLDRVAVKSVRSAGPFYNVPPGLVDSRGELAFEFGFLVGDQRGIPVRPRYRPTP